MKTMVQFLQEQEPELQKFTTLDTTLYNLIQVINEVVEPAEDPLIIEIISDMLDKGWIRFSDSSKKQISDISLN